MTVLYHSPASCLSPQPYDDSIDGLAFVWSELSGRNCLQKTPLQRPLGVLHCRLHGSQSEEGEEIKSKGPTELSGDELLQVYFLSWWPSVGTSVAQGGRRE